MAEDEEIRILNAAEFTIISNAERINAQPSETAGW
jgi:hypothetical protein